ncbi:hypothetical protein C8Q80DRAFT_892145 [Daedaleopsis nitida]|nr:hypothetical protein C8Q80DRAFT_892145 [Daedaleopsis nitida]
MFLYSYPDDDDDIEDYGFDLDDLLSGSSPSRRVSFTTSSERDRPCIRTPVKPKAPAFRPLPHLTHGPGSVTSPPTTLGSAKPRNSDLLPAENTRLSAPPLVQLPVTPIRPRTRTPSPRAVSAPRENDSADIDVNDGLPPSSPIASSPLSSPLSSPARPSDETVRPVTPDPARDSSLPPSSPIPVPCTPPRDLQREAEMEMDLIASPPSPTLDVLRITSRVSVRALLNPPAPALTPPVTDSDSAMDDVPIADHDDVQVDVDATPPDEQIEVDADVAPLALDEARELVSAEMKEDAMVDVTPAMAADEVTLETIQVRPTVVVFSYTSRVVSFR